MSDDATIEDEPEVERQSPSSRPETETGLLKWSYIFEIASKQWAVFLLVSIAIGVFLYLSARQRHKEKKTNSAIRRDHIQGGGKGGSRKSPNKRE